MKEVRNRTIKNESITLDDTKFVDCEFVNCQIKYSGGEFGMEGVRLTNSHYSFTGAAERTIRFLQWAKILSQDPSKWVALPNEPDLLA